MDRAELYSNIVICVRPRAGLAPDVQKSQVPIILICDDDDSLREITVDYAKRSISGCVVIEARNGGEGLAKYREFKPHVVLTDLYMPEMSGIEMATAILKNDVKATIVLLTGLADKNVVLDVLRLGAHDVLEKPFTFETFEITLKKALPELHKAAAQYNVAQFIEVMHRFVGRELAEKSTPYQLVKIYNDNVVTSESLVGIIMPSGEVIEVKSDFVP